jgi:hypothetical protein
MMELGAENDQLKKLIAELNLEKMILTEASNVDFYTARVGCNEQARQHLGGRS